MKKNMYLSELWNSDVENVLGSLNEIDRLENKVIMITGATGLICSSIVDILIKYNETHDNYITIVVAARSEDKVRNRFGKYFDKPYFVYLKYDANDQNVNFDKKVDFIIHGASNADPNRVMKEPVETMTSNFTGLLALLNYAKVVGTKRLLYISSSEVYGKKDVEESYCESEYGYIDLLNVRNSYSISKRAAETLCLSYSSEYGVETVITRPGHIYGPTASVFDSRVSSKWAYDVIDNKSIIMKSDGKQVRSYVYCLDCAAAILKVLMVGEKGTAYNISNPDSVISIKEMAEILATAGNVDLKMELPTEDEKKGFNPMLNSSLDASRLLKLGWKGCFNAETGFSHTVTILREVCN